jgi:hypothetical protein
MKRRVFPIVLLTTLLSACAGLPLTAAEFRQAARNRAAFSTSESFEVKRPFAEVVQTFKKKAPECLSYDIGSTRKPVIGFGSSTHFYGRAKPTLSVSANKAELDFQVKYKSTATKAPDDGYYYLVADIYPLGANRTRVDLYWRTKVDTLARAVRGWATGENLGCPDPSAYL